MYGGPCGEYMYEGLARSPGPVCGVRSGTGGRGGVWVGTTREPKVGARHGTARAQPPKARHGKTKA